jgi:hypothetical protein
VAVGGWVPGLHQTPYDPYDIRHTPYDIRHTTYGHLKGISAPYEPQYDPYDIRHTVPGVWRRCNAGVHEDLRARTRIWLSKLCVATFAARHNRGLCWAVPRWLLSTTISCAVTSTGVISHAADATGPRCIMRLGKSGRQLRGEIANFAPKSEKSTIFTLFRKISAPAG